MSLLEALLLGLIQGLTEFLPVSSSGHLVLAEALLGASSPGILFEVVVHAGTMLAVVAFYRRRLGRLAQGALRGRPAALGYVGRLGVATLPAVLVTLLARPFFEAQFEEPRAAAAGLLLTGALLWTTRRTLPRAEGAEPDWRAAWWIGCAQALAILPGVSRSGATVAAALALGVRPLAAAEFSFLMSIPAVAGAVVVGWARADAVSSDVLAGALAGAALAFGSGIAALGIFVRALRTRYFHRFAYYVWGLGALALAWTLG